MIQSNTYIIHQLLYLGLCLIIEQYINQAEVISWKQYITQNSM